MSEELRVDSAFGDTSTVDGEIFLSATWGIVVNHPWDDLFSHTALTNDKHGKICWRNL